jgi:hypothetical protein
MDFSCTNCKWKPAEQERKPELTIYQSGAYRIHDGVITAKIKIVDESQTKVIEFTATGTDWKMIMEQQVKFFEACPGKI